MQTFVKDGREVVCSNATDAVNLRAKGWKEKPAKPHKAHAAPAPKPEAPEEEVKPENPDK